MKSTIIKKDQKRKTYYFDQTTSLSIVYGEFGYKEYYFKSEACTLFADNVRFNPCEIYTTRERKEYVRSIYFEKGFPLIDRNYPTRITWTSFDCKESGFYVTTQTICRKEGEKIIHLKHTSSPFDGEKLYFDGMMVAHEIEFFTALIYTFHYPEQTRSNGG